MRRHPLQMPLFVLASLFVAGSVVTWPERRSAASVVDPMPAAVASSMPLADDPGSAFAPPMRDPFADPPVPSARPALAVSPPPAPDARRSYEPVPAIPSLPANDGAGFPRATAGRPAALRAEPVGVVRAVVLGPHPFALVDDAKRVRIVALGDRLDADVVTAIDEAGIVLSSGTRLPLIAHDSFGKAAP